MTDAMRLRISQPTGADPCSTLFSSAHVVAIVSIVLFAWDVKMLVTVFSRWTKFFSMEVGGISMRS